MAVSRTLTHAGAADVAPWIERFARVGYAAKAVLYATIGFLAAKAALGDGGRTTDSRGAMAEVLNAPGGRVLLGIMAVGVAAYALWRAVEAATDPERRGHDAKGVALRLGNAARAVFHASLAASALHAAVGDRANDGDGGGRAEGATARVLELPGGELIVWIAALAFIGYGVYQLYRAYAAKLSEQLDIGRMSREAGRWVIGVSRFGIAARGVVFSAVGFLLARAASRHSPGEAGGIGDALDAVASLGRLPLAAIALGLVAYGIYQLLNARYRRIRATVHA